MDYPLWHPTVGTGVVMGVVAIAHVVVAHFAIGGGLVIVAAEEWAARRNDAAMRDLARRGSVALIFLPTVFGAISGVGIWIIAGLVAPAATSTLLHVFVWVWAIEWVFFLVEVTAALTYYATWDTLPSHEHRCVGWLYVAAAYLSLVAINGVVTFMLTPGRWLMTRKFGDAFLNPTYFPSLVLRTGAALLTAAALLALLLLRLPSAGRLRVARYLGVWLSVGGLLSAAGYVWWERALPASVRALFAGEGALLPALAATRSLLQIALGTALLVGLAAYVAWPRAARAPAAVLLLAGAIGFLGGYERLREGARKPYLIRGYQFSTGLRAGEIVPIDREGAASRLWRVHRGPVREPDALGKRLFAAECGVCHTIDGYLGIRKRLPGDRDLIDGVVGALREQGTIYARLAAGEPVDVSKLEYPFMPPFVGTEEERRALVDYLASLASSPPAGSGTGR